MPGWVVSKTHSPMWLSVLLQSNISSTTIFSSVMVTGADAITVRPAPLLAVAVTMTRPSPRAVSFPDDVMLASKVGSPPVPLTDHRTAPLSGITAASIGTTSPRVTWVPRTVMAETGGLMPAVSASGETPKVVRTTSPRDGRRTVMPMPRLTPLRTRAATGAPSASTGRSASK